MPFIQWLLRHGGCILWPSPLKLQHPIHQFHGIEHSNAFLAMIRPVELRVFHVLIPRRFQSVYHFSNSSRIPPIIAACHRPNR